MNLTIEIEGTFYKVEAKNERGETLLSHFIDGVIEPKELLDYENYLNITPLAYDVWCEIHLV